MDKWRSKNKVPSIISEDSLLPPTLRHLNPSPYSVNDEPRKKKRTINGFFKRVSSILDAQTSSSSLEDLPAGRHRRKHKGKSKSKANAHAHPTSAENQQSMGDLLNANMDLLEARLSNNNSQSRSSDGSMDGPRRVRKDKVKARVEARRDQQLRGDSSLDESGAELEQSQRNGIDPTKKRTRASRTERYLKRMCNGGNVSNGKNGSSTVISPAAETRTYVVEQFQPIERVLPTGYAHDVTARVNGDSYAVPYDHDITNDNFYARHTQVGVNPLVQQTLQYFNEFDRNMTAQPTQHKPRNQHRPPPDLPPKNNPAPPKPPSRDHTSRILVNGASLDKYQKMMKHIPRSPEQSRYFDKENEYHPSSRSSLYSPNTEVRNINEGRYHLAGSPNPAMHKYEIPRSPPRSPLRDPLNTITYGGNVVNRPRPTQAEKNKAKYVDQPTACFSTILQSNGYENSNHVASKVHRPNSRRSSKNLEEALCELEAIYNSLQLGDEELLDRAERRTMEEFLYKGFTASPDAYDAADPACRRKTWADPSLNNYKDEPDRLKDDMAYRRMHPKERPTSVDGQSSLSSISYLMTSPVPSRRDMPYVDTRSKPRRKEPDVTLDDVVFRSMQYANNTLKVVEPQPPFGIPIGPITTAADSDYLHTNPADSDRARSPYIPCKEPDLVTDDLAFRNLRKDTQPSSRQSSPSFLPSTPSPLPYGFKKKRAVRSLSANLYGLINKPTSPMDPDSEDLLSIHTNSTLDDYYHDMPKHIGRRISDPEVMSPNWQKSTWQSLDVSRKRHTECRKDNYSDLDLSNRSCDESSDERIRPICERSRVGDDNTDHKATSDRGSSCLSSVCSTPPPPPPRSVEPFTEHEISVYKKLCQDLENLVQLTKGINDVPAPSEFVAPPSPNASSAEQNISVANLDKRSPSKPLPEESSTKTSLEDALVSCEEKADGDMSPIKPELSSIFNSSKGLREKSNPSASSCENKKEEVERTLEVKKEEVAEEKSFKEITKDICDLVARDSAEIKPVKSLAEPKKSVGDREKKREKRKESKGSDDDDEEEKKDKVDENVFLRNVQLAKLSGDWKESTPNSAVVNRRTSLVNDDNRHWEGMNKCNHKYNSMPAKTSSLLMFRQYGSKRKSKNRKSMCTIS